MCVYIPTLLDDIVDDVLCFSGAVALIAHGVSKKSVGFLGTDYAVIAYVIILVVCKPIRHNRCSNASFYHGMCNVPVLGDKNDIYIKFCVFE